MIQLVVSTHLKNISQVGSFPQLGMNIKNIWNHHLDDELAIQDHENSSSIASNCQEQIHQVPGRLWMFRDYPPWNWPICAPENGWLEEYHFFLGWCKNCQVRTLSFRVGTWFKSESIFPNLRKVQLLVHHIICCIWDVGLQSFPGYLRKIDPCP